MVPKLRFESYFDNWFSNKLSDLAVDNTLSNGVFNDPLNVGSGYKLINVVNMYKEPCIDENDLSLLNLDEKTFRKNQVFFGDIFFTRSSLVKEGIAWSNIYLGHSKDVTFDGHLIKLTPNLKKINPKFLYFCLKTSLIRKQLIESGKTATMTTIGQSDVGKTLAFIPQLKEQTKIANFLSSVDERITLLNKQYDLLCQYKKGMMQRVFSQEVRFKGSTPWKSENLFGLAVNNTLTNGVFNDPMNTGSGYKLINVVNMYKEPYIDENDLTLLNLDEKTFNKNKVKNGDIFFTRSSLVKEGIAWSNIYLGNSDDVTYDGHLIKMTPDKTKVFPQFLYYCLKTSQVRSQLIKGGKTATMTTIGQDDVGKTSLHIPSLNEQIKIANFLSAIDDKITTKKIQLDKLKTWKQGLLQQMFV
ncbi:TPA: restriction endonuclease subunit S [Yersinia enterocolitica]|uniref:restriction endonuclease subunit S n=1 Tax=Yersinia enterocolitica TaxID=630 RepID=UPI0033086BA2|nr:restriction endonuclease subunit S [Yersinia enterocolitica]